MRGHTPAGRSRMASACVIDPPRDCAVCRAASAGFKRVRAAHLSRVVLDDVVRIHPHTRAA
jgi:hypothetical protein